MYRNAHIQHMPMAPISQLVALRSPKSASQITSKVQCLNIENEYGLALDVIPVLHLDVESLFE